MRSVKGAVEAVVVAATVFSGSESLSLCVWTTYSVYYT